MTEWNEFRALDLPRLAKGMTTAAMADLSKRLIKKSKAQALWLRCSKNTGRTL